MKTPNIDYVMNMTQEFLDGKIDETGYWLDFPYEIEQRYQKMVREHRDYAELIYDYLVEAGADQYNNLSSAEFKELIHKNYRYIKSVARDGFC